MQIFYDKNTRQIIFLHLPRGTGKFKYLIQVKRGQHLSIRSTSDHTRLTQHLKKYCKSSNNMSISLRVVGGTRWKARGRRFDSRRRHTFSF